MVFKNSKQEVQERMQSEWLWGLRNKITKKPVPSTMSEPGIGYQPQQAPGAWHIEEIWWPKMDEVTEKARVAEDKYDKKTMWEWQKRAQHDEDLDTLIMTLSMFLPAPAIELGVGKLIGKLVWKLWTKSFKPQLAEEAVERFLQKWINSESKVLWWKFKSKKLEWPYVVTKPFETALDRKISNNTYNSLFEWKNPALESIAKRYFEENGSLNWLDDFMDSYIKKSNGRFTEGNYAGSNRVQDMQRAYDEWIFKKQSLDNVLDDDVDIRYWDYITE